jgi:hypothetical protein
MEAKIVDELEDSKVNEVISNSLLFKGASKQVINEVIKKPRTSSKRF